MTSKKGLGTTVNMLIDLQKGGEGDLESRDSLPVNADALKNRKILVVDDNDMNRLVATTILGNYGTVIFEAANGREAVAFLRGQLVDVVLMDIQMPVMNGLEASQLIRKEISADLPIIALTANAIRGENDKCIAAGMNGYLSKPFEEKAFIKIICEWIARQPVAVPAGEDVGLEPPAAALYDFHRLEAIGDAVFVEKMIRLFIEQAPAAVRELKDAADRKDLTTVFAKAHFLKPVIHNFSIDCLHDEVIELERLALSETASERIDQIVQVISDVVGEVIGRLQGRG